MSNIQKLLKLNYSNFKAINKAIIFTIILFVLMSMVNPIFLSMLINIIVFKMTYDLIAYEDSYGVNNLIGYLPVKREEYVTSKYIAFIINLGIGIVIFTITYYIANKYTPISEILISYKLMLSASLLSTVIGVSIIIPLILKIGANKIRIIGVIVIIISMLLPFVILPLEWMVSNVVVNGFEKYILEIINGIGFPIISLIGSIIIIGISYKISLKIYINKDM